MIVGLLVFSTLWSRHRPFSYHSLYVHRPSISLGLFWYRQSLYLPLKVQEEERWIYFRVEYRWREGVRAATTTKKRSFLYLFLSNKCCTLYSMYMYSIEGQEMERMTHNFWAF